jgi:hypothetical protein
MKEAVEETDHTVVWVRVRMLVVFDRNNEILVGLDVVVVVVAVAVAVADVVAVVEAFVGGIVVPMAAVAVVQVLRLGGLVETLTVLEEYHMMFVYRRVGGTHIHIHIRMSHADCSYCIEEDSGSILDSCLCLVLLMSSRAS